MLRALLLAGLAALAAGGRAGAAETRKVTYEDDILPIFRDNCLKCHNPDKLKGDLDLTSFSGVLKGGGSGATLNAGDPDGSQLFKSVTHAEEPEMPPKGKLSDREIGLIRQWIEGGLLQGAGSKAVAAARPATDLTLKKVSVGRPEGPPPMPAALRYEPFAHAVQGTPLSALAASPWAPLVALGGAHQIALYHSGDLDYLGVLPFPEGLVCDVKFSRDGRLLLAAGGRGGHSGVVAVWDVVQGTRVVTVGDQYDSVLAADLSPDRQWVALGGPDRVLKIYRTSDGALEHRIKKHTDWVTAVEFSPDGKYLATGDRTGGLVLWEAATGQEMFALNGHKGAITAVTWRGDSELVASASEDGTLKLWKAADGSALRSLNAHPGGALAARFNREGRIVSAGRDHKVQIWDVSGRNVATLPFSGELPNRVTFSDDGRRVIGSDWKGRVLVWDAAGAKALGELDANPPTLAERVERGVRKIGALQEELARTDAQQAAAEAEARRTEGVLVEKKRQLAEIQARPAATEAGSRPSSEAATPLDSVRKDLAAVSKQADGAKRKLTELRKTREETAARLAAEQAALAKWKALQHAKTPAESAGKVSLAEPARR